MTTPIQASSALDEDEKYAPPSLGNEKQVHPQDEDKIAPRDENEVIAQDETKEQNDTSATDPKPLQKWNQPRINMWRYFATLYSFIVLGMNDAAYGALIPYLETYYSISYTIVSLVFLAPLVGYIAAAFLNNTIHMRYGQLGVSTIAPSCHIIAYAVTCSHPPYPVLPILFMISGFGCGLLDGAWNAWIGNMEKANEFLGFLHGAYGAGAAMGPLIATAMITKGGRMWFEFYYVMVGLAVLELIFCVLTWRKATGAAFLASNPTDQSSRSAVKESISNHITWICAFFLLLYVGIEVALGGWLVDFMLRVRHGAGFASGLVATGFWLGLTFGRIVLGFVTECIGEKFAIASYLLICMALELCFWLIPSFVSSAVFAGWLGFFLGPLFPAAVVVATKLLPQRLHVTAIGFSAAFGGSGAAIFPFAVGAIAQSKGVQVLQPVVFALIVADLALWCLLPGGFRKRGLEEVQKEREERLTETTVEEGQEFQSRPRRTLRRLRKNIGIT